MQVPPLPKKFKIPSLGKGSITDRATKSLPRSWLTLPLFGHPFATKLYNVHLEAARNIETEGDSISFGSISLPKKDLEDISLKLNTACTSVAEEKNLPGRGFMSVKSLRGCEVGWTGVCAAHLTSLFHDLPGTFIHQAPTYNSTGTPSTADWYFAKSDSSGRCLDPLLCGDGQLHSIDAAVRTSVYHCQNCALSQHKTSDWPVMLCLSATPRVACVFITIPVNQAIWQVKVIESSTLWNKALLCTLYYGLYELQRSYMATPAPLTCNHPKDGLIPLKDTELVAVFKEGKRVRKYFDTLDNLKKPNFPIVKEYSNLSNVEVSSITTDGRIKCLSYDFVEGDHDPKILAQFVSVINILNELHENDIVHSDVRLANMVFDDETSYLIDFDLAGSVGSQYPAGYSYLDERHNDARPLARREKIHDRYSLWYIIRACLRKDLKQIMNMDIRLCDITLSY